MNHISCYTLGYYSQYIIQESGLIPQLEVLPSPGNAITAIRSNPANPAGGVNESAPRIIMIYNNTEYDGILDSYSFGKTLEAVVLIHD